MTTKLTDEEINVAICEWRGWKNTKEKPALYWKDGEWSFVGELPNHLTGIEALGHMHEATLTLDAEKSRKFCFALEQVVKETTPENEGRWWEFHCLNATARQRAIALLRTVKPELFQQ